TLTFFNDGCDTIVVSKNATVWQPGWSATDTTFPQTLLPGGSFRVHVRFAPTKAGASTQYLDYHFDGPTGTGQASDEVVLAATAVLGSAQFALRETALDFGTIPI